MSVFLVVLLGLMALPVQGQSLRLDEYSETLKPNKVISGWDSTKFSPVFGSGNKFFFQFVYKSPEEHYLHLASGDDNSFSVGSKKEIKLADWPVLSWEWKVTTTPKGGDVQIKEKDDQAGSICLVVDPGMTSFDSSLCYIYENDGPKDQVLTSKKDEKAKYIIVRSAKADGLGKWFSEKRNLLEDYKKAFGRTPTKIGVIGMQIDSNDTKSSGEAFFRKIILTKK